MVLWKFSWPLRCPPHTFLERYKILNTLFTVNTRELEWCTRNEHDTSRLVLYFNLYRTLPCAFFVSKFTVNFELLQEILRLYFPLCYCLVFLFLCNCVCYPSFLLSYLQSFLVYKGPISVLKGRFLGKKFSGGTAPRPHSLSSRPGAMAP